jgi:hypothetical protein
VAAAVAAYDDAFEPVWTAEGGLRGHHVTRVDARTDVRRGERDLAVGRGSE